MGFVSFSKLLLLLFWVGSGRMELGKQVLNIERCATKKELGTHVGIPVDFRSHVLLLFHGLGANCYDFWCLGSRLRI